MLEKLRSVVDAIINIVYPPDENSPVLTDGDRLTFLIAYAFIVFMVTSFT